MSGFNRKKGKGLVILCLMDDESITFLVLLLKALSCDRLPEEI